MPLNWIDVTPLSFNTLLLLERAQLSWLPGHAPEGEMAIALRANPAVEWYLRHKCPDLNKWLDEVMSHSHPANSERTRQAEIAIMEKLNDWVVYVVDPVIYDARPFLGWDSNELLSLTDFTGATVIDVGSGTGRLALTVAPIAKTVFAVEPVGNLRRYIKQKARAQGLHNVFSADGLITDIPFPDDFADVTMGGHVYGTYPEREYLEVARVTKPGGMVIHCPGNNDRDNETHTYLVSQGFRWARFEEPEDGIKRKYWKTIRIPAPETQTRKLNR